MKLYTPEYINNLIDKRTEGYRYLIEDRTYGVMDKIKIICEKHGEFEQRIHNHFYIGSRCPKCSYSRSIEINKEVEYLLETKSIKVLEYKGYRLKSIFLCENHGKFKSNIENAKLHGCPKCSVDRNINIEIDKFIKMSTSIWGKLIEFDYDSLEYNGSRKKMRLFSFSTGWIEQLPGGHLSGCLPKRSSGEEILSNILSIRNVKYIKQKTFDGCFNIKKLRFDFYIPSLNTCIEYNGIQHYRPIEFFGGQDRYLDQIKNDNIKRKFCDKNGIKLIIIPYNEPIVEKLKEII